MRPTTPASADDPRLAGPVDASAVDAAPHPPTGPQPHMPAPAAGGGLRSRARAVVAPYVALTKPRVIELLLVTTVPTMVLAADGMPSLWLVVATLFGGGTAAASANVLNCVLDRDIDVVMHRTKRRPLATGQVTARSAALFGAALGVVSLVWLWFVVNPVSSLLAAAAMLIYVVGYTMILKRRTPQNIVWGGAAGCMPVLIGWSSVTGGLAWAPVLLFGVVFFWTPPHYWPLSMKFRRDYAAAGVPMLPVVARDTKVAGEMVAYALAMVACSLLLVPVAGLSWVYGLVALGLGAWFTWSCVDLLRRARDPRKPLKAMSVFHGSITYLTLLSVAIVADVFLPF